MEQTERVSGAVVFRACGQQSPTHPKKYKTGHHSNGRENKIEKYLFAVEPEKRYRARPTKRANKHVDEEKHNRLMARDRKKIK